MVKKINQFKKCPKCHHMVSKKVNFCPICGYHFDYKHNQNKKYHIHHLTRMQHTKIKQPSPLGVLKIKLHEWKSPSKTNDDYNNDNKNNQHVNHKSYDLSSALRYTKVHIIGACIIIVLLIFLGIICIHGGSSAINDSQPMPHNSSKDTNKPHHVSVNKKAKYPIKHVWSAMQSDLNNRAVSKPYARYFVYGRHNSAYTSLVSWKAEIFNTTPANNLSGIKTKPEKYTIKNHKLSYVVKYEFPQSINRIQVQKYKWHAIIKGHRIFNMYSNTTPSISKTITK